VGRCLGKGRASSWPPRIIVFTEVGRSSLLLEYDPTYVIDELIVYVKIYTVDYKVLMMGKYRKTLPDSKLTGDPESKQVVKILKAVFAAQKKKLGGDASVSPNDHPHHLLYLNPVLQAILAAHKSNPLPAHQYQAYVIKSAAYRLFLAEKELADRMKEAVKEAKENPKPATKRAAGGAAGGQAKKLKIAGLPAKWRHLGY
jgi:hypothetical protein